MHPLHRVLSYVPVHSSHLLISSPLMHLITSHASYLLTSSLLSSSQLIMSSHHHYLIISLSSSRHHHHHHTPLSCGPSIRYSTMSIFCLPLVHLPWCLPSITTLNSPQPLTIDQSSLLRSCSLFYTFQQALPMVRVKST